MATATKLLRPLIASGERDFGVSRDFFANLVDKPGCHTEPKHRVEAATETLGQ
jgi:hypothetical protein